MPAVTSFGLVLVGEPDLIFLAHATGTRHWDIPKGGAEEGESPLQAVLREVLEETGLKIDGSALTDLGVQAYRPDKQLHLFAARVAPESLVPSQCRCDSHFVHARTGMRTPEVDRFSWVPFHLIEEHCGKNLVRVLSHDLNLRDLLVRLPLSTVIQAAGH